MAVQAERVQKLNDAPERSGAKYILYWAQMNRRVDANHGLLYAAELANKYKLPVLYYEGLTCTYEWANDRLHTFVLEGVPETARRLEKAGVGYVFYLRAKKNSPNNVLYELAKDAAAVVTDDYPVFINHDHNARVPAKVDVAYYAVDSSCVVPMSKLAKREYAAYTIRPKIHRLLPDYLKPPDSLKVATRFSARIPKFHTDVTEANIAKLVAGCDIDHSVSPSPSFKGGRQAAEILLKQFLHDRLARFAEERNEPSLHATSHMSPYLHFGQLSSLEIALGAQDYAKKHKVNADAYLEELLVRRELSFNYARHVKDPGDLKNLPDWCQQNMEQHAKDQRPKIYTAKQLENSETDDELWNATQTEMRVRGKIHGYYRMYWGKKIIEWLPGYQAAADFMIDIHGRYALDGRDPNTFTNILWCFGLHDRAWPTRPIFGKMRYMSHGGMMHKTKPRPYIDEMAELERTGKDANKVAP